MGISEGIFFGLLAMVGFGMSTALSRIPSQDLGGIKTIFYRGIGFTALQLLLLAFFFPPNITLQGVLIASVIAIFSYLPILFFYKGLGVGRVGIVAPIGGSSALITILLAVIFLQEQLSSWQVAATLLIFLGVILLSINFQDFKNSELLMLSSGIPFALLAALGWGIVFFLYKYSVDLNGALLTSVIVEFFILLLSGLQMRLTHTSFALPTGYYKKFIPLVLFSIIGILAYNYGIQGSAVSLVIVLFMANPLLATLYARIILKEKLLIQQYVAICIIILGISIITLLK